MTGKPGQTATYVPRDTSADPSQSFNDPRCHGDADADYAAGLDMPRRRCTDQSLPPTRTQKKQD